MGQYLLGLDAGNTMTKAVLFDLDGKEIGATGRRNAILFPAPGHTERDPDLMWREVVGEIQELLATTGVAADEIAAVSVSGYGAGLYLVDKAGRPVRNGIMSTDSRGAGLVDRWTRDGRAARVAHQVQQRFWPGQSTVLMAWLGAHEPAVLEATCTVLACKDYLRAQLCGDFSTDATDAGIAGLIGGTTRDYPDALFEELQLSAWRAKLPRIGRCDEVVGEVSRQAAALTGLRAGTPVVRGLVDVCAAALASGVSRPDQLSVIAGTFSINSSLHAQPRMDVLPMLQLRYPLGDYLLATEGSATSASNFEWYCKAVLGADAIAAAERRGHSIYEECSERVSGVLERPNDILFLPFLFGGPGGAPAGLVGLQASHSGADVLRAIFEGIVFAHKLDIDLLLSGRDRAPVRSIRLTGGAARSAVWSQMFADVLGLPVEVTQGCELGARGTAMCAAVALGLVPDFPAAVERMVRVERVYTPDPARHEAYARKFSRFSKTSQALAALAPALAA